jgi:ATP-binding cassette subfamily F protein uup
METLEVLEDRLTSYSGTLIVVSHDREFLDNVVTSVLVFEDDGRVKEYVGGYSDWLRQGRALADTDNPVPAALGTNPSTGARTGPKPKKLGFNEQRELDALPKSIEAMEQRLLQLQAQISDPSFYAQDRTAVQSVLDEFDAVQSRIDAAMQRWSALEDRQQAFQKSRLQRPG